MLQLKNIQKKYKTGELEQTALDGISLSFRDNEFVAILGPSGSGKTTLLNMVGGLDRYDEGDLIINGISTREYKDKDWDSYRNHTIGFVFQSYNLIPHQTILANVELALTISGISRGERKRRAIEALKKVGLQDHIHKRPNQMSGGQMQRVAIARALVNNPDIVLADEPTGALDTETSLQVMELLKEVAKDRLVIMVTHNGELAEAYANRIVKLRDGKIKADTNPFEEVTVEEREHKKTGKASMSFLTSLSLSFNNLKTKKARTFLTAFAGSIGIIGIALILAISTGVNTYIEDLQKSTMTSYPLTIESMAFDFTGMMTQGQSAHMEMLEEKERDEVYADSTDLIMTNAVKSSITENDLTAFKKYLDDPKSEIQDYVGEKGIIYSYNAKFQVYAYDEDGNCINTNQETESDAASTRTSMQLEMMNTMFDVSIDEPGAENFTEILPGTGDETVSSIVKDNYELVYGQWPENYDEVILVLNQNNGISTTQMYQLGFVSREKFNSLCEKIANKEEPEKISWDYKKICEQKFYLVPACDYFVEKEGGTFTGIAAGTIEEAALVKEGIPLKISGIIRPKEDADTVSITTPVVYTTALTQHLIEYTDKSPVIQAQEKEKDKNVLTGMQFGAMTGYIKGDTYEDNMNMFGKISYDAPDTISIYIDTFDDKEQVARCIEDYNKSVPEKEQISYTDYIALLTSSLTSMVDIVSYVLIAFVAVSLVVSCIMISIITHISVLERTKEIGILRALGASKRNISQVFNAETFIIGFCSGVLGIVVSKLLTIPINAIIHTLADSDDVNAILSIPAAVVLILLSMFITILGGWIPAKKAAKKDPVIALRTE